MIRLRLGDQKKKYIRERNIGYDSTLLVQIVVPLLNDPRRLSLLVFVPRRRSLRKCQGRVPVIIVGVLPLQPLGRILRFDDAQYSSLAIL